MRSTYLAGALASGAVALTTPALAVAATTSRVSLSSTGVELNASSSGASLSADGRYTGFSSVATNGVTGDSNGVADVFVRDRSSRKTIRVSVSSAGGQGNGASREVAVSRGGRYVAFTSDATTLVGSDTNGTNDVFLRDRDTDGDGIYDEAGAVSTRRMSVSSSGAQANAGASSAAIGSGRYVAFSSAASNLVSGDTNGTADIFVRDRTSSRTVRVSVSSTGGQMAVGSYQPSISSSGRWVAFLTEDEYEGATRGFVRDRDTDADGIFDEPTSVRTISVGPGNAGTFGISANGRYITYVEYSVDGERSDVFAHDLRTGKAAIMTVSSSGVLANRGGGRSSLRAISGNGRYVSFTSYADNLVSGDTNGVNDIFVRDRDTDADGIYDESGSVRTTRASVSSTDLQANAESDGAVMTEHGNYVGFESAATNLSTYADSNAAWDVFLRTNP